MSGFNMDGYVDVAERIRDFAAKYPEGSLQSSIELLAEPLGWLCTARAYRTADDSRPGVGHAFEPVPGKTPYTKDSECMNAETSAWGRAIVALGFDTKKIASRQEVQARNGSAAGDSVVGGAVSTATENRAPAPTPSQADAHGLQASRADHVGATPGDASDKQKAMIRRLAKKLNLSAGDVDSLGKREASAKIEELLGLEKLAADTVTVGGNSDPDSDIPFARTFA